MNKANSLLLLMVITGSTLAYHNSTPESSTHSPQVKSEIKSKEGSWVLEVRSPDKTKPVCDLGPTSALAETLHEFFWDPNHPKGSPRFVIALVPDPVHTHLSLFFDRTIDVIDEAAEASGKYQLDRASLHWMEESPTVPPTLSDSSKPCPGLMIFRPTGEDDHPLVVLIVAETPIGGINKDQFENALQLEDESRKMLVLQKTKDKKSAQAATKIPVGHSPRHGITKKGDPVPPQKGDPSNETEVSVLGPTFTGSLYSLRDLLQFCPRRIFRIYSGTISGGRSVREFLDWKRRVAPKSTFLTFQEDDEYKLAKFLKYNAAQNPKPHKPTVALLSENETEYGRHDDVNTGPTSANGAGRPNDKCLAAEKSEKVATDSCGAPDRPECKLNKEVVRLYFPREISRFRSAYQRDVGSENSQAKNPNRSTLKLNLDENGEENDTIEPFSHNQYPLSQESVLLGIVSALKGHGIQSVVIRASDPVDELFLASYLRKAYPEGRIITLGADLLFRREEGSALFGTLALTTYSLLPIVDDYLNKGQATDSGSHVDRVLPDSNAVGTFNAMMVLLDEISRPEANRGPVLAHVNTLEYGRYRWTGPENTNRQVSLPPVWLTTLGRNGYWPVTTLDDEDLRSTPLSPRCCSILTPMTPEKGEKEVAPPMPIPDSYRFLCWFAMLLTATHLSLLFSGSVLSSSEITATFARVPNAGRPFLLAIQMLCIGAILLICAVPWIVDGSFFQAGLVPVCLGATLVAVVIISGADLWRRSSLEYHRTKFRAVVIVSVVVLLSATLLAIIELRGGELFGAFFVASWRMILFRFVNLTSAVSPVISVLLLICAIYWWCWHNLQGLCYLDSRAPQLPPTDEEAFPGGNDLFFTIRQPQVIRLRNVMSPFGMDTRVYVPAFVAIGGVLAAAHTFWLVKSLEGYKFDFVFNCMLLGVLFLLVKNIARLLITWLECARLLQALERLRFRRSFSLIKGFTWKPISSSGGSTLRDSYRLVSLEFETLQNACNALTKVKLIAEPSGEHASADAIHHLFARRELLLKQRILIGNMYKAAIEQYFGSRFVKLDEDPGYQHIHSTITFGHLRHVYHALTAPKRNGMTGLIPAFGLLQAEFAKVCSAVLAILAPLWLLEDDPITTDAKALDNLGDPGQRAKALLEEFVCLVYLNFLLSVLGRIRSLVMSTAGLFVLPMVAVAMYPFQPKETLHSFLVVIFFAIIGVVAFVYGQMHKDATLSRITNTNPGELGWDFWARIAGFTVVPLLSLLAAQFPAFNNFIFAWLQPALEHLGH